jgi:hypothetical protein
LIDAALGMAERLEASWVVSASRRIEPYREDLP